MKEVLSFEVMGVSGQKALTYFISGECSLGYNDNFQAYVHDTFRIYLSGPKLNYFDSLPTREKKCAYLTKLINADND